MQISCAYMHTRSPILPQVTREKRDSNVALSLWRLRVMWVCVEESGVHVYRFRVHKETEKVVPFHLTSWNTVIAFTSVDVRDPN